MLLFCHFMSPLAPLVRAGSAKPTSGVSEALQQLAKRILPFAKGEFTPSPPPALLDRLTDHLLVVASDAVEAAAAEVQPLGRVEWVAGRVPPHAELARALCMSSAVALTRRTLN